jgi:hypothetical protein
MLYRKRIVSPIDQNSGISLICYKYHIDMIMSDFRQTKWGPPMSKAVMKSGKGLPRVGDIMTYLFRFVRFIQHCQGG